MPTTRQIQPMGFLGRLEAIRVPTIGKGRKGSIAHNGVLMPPVPQLLGGRTGRVAICRATAARNKATERAASDQASHEVTRVLIPLAPCSGACFLRSRHYSTVLPSPQRYGKRYEVEEWANQRRESDAQACSQGIWRSSSPRCTVSTLRTRRPPAGSPRRITTPGHAPRSTSRAG